MEQTLEEKIDFEARRVAAAFGVGEWAHIETTDISRTYSGHFGDSSIEWILDPDDGHLVAIILPKQYDEPVDQSTDEIWLDLGNELERFTSDNAQLMARGLYRLGIEEIETYSVQLPDLSAHEKLELRLSMPREFWPQKWLEE